MRLAFIFASQSRMDFRCLHHLAEKRLFWGHTAVSRTDLVVFSNSHHPGKKQIHAKDGEKMWKICARIHLSSLLFADQHSERRSKKLNNGTVWNLISWLKKQKNHTTSPPFAYTARKTNEFPLKIHGWKMYFLLKCSFLLRGHSLVVWFPRFFASTFRLFSKTRSWSVRIALRPKILEWQSPACLTCKRGGRLCFFLGGKLDVLCI